ncbi:hypothetical protein PVAP13_2KG404010 [Panicum virgatum]|uniref:Uncharacterized protein n=1 Tax=Panicum virgatum TaxID=38727 RepID=A0A8T0WE09_PANVG|nr:hypothetical protein PVAP13_2KG404010 [Panicum virgatum]
MSPTHQLSRVRLLGRRMAAASAASSEGTHGAPSPRASGGLRKGARNAATRNRRGARVHAGPPAASARIRTAAVPAKARAEATPVEAHSVASRTHGGGLSCLDAHSSGFRQGTSSREVAPGDIEGSHGPRRLCRAAPGARSLALSRVVH